MMVVHMLCMETWPLLSLYLSLRFRFQQKVALVVLFEEMESKPLFLPFLSSLVPHAVFHDNPASKQIENN